MQHSTNILNILQSCLFPLCCPLYCGSKGKMVRFWNEDLQLSYSAISASAEAAVPFISVSCSYTKKSAIVKLREREGRRVDLGRSLKGHL